MAKLPDIELPTGEHIPIEAQPFTGRTHQIRVHLAWGGHPVLGDPLYGSGTARGLALRAVELSYVNPFTRRKVMIQADTGEFLNTFWRE